MGVGRVDGLINGSRWKGVGGAEVILIPVIDERELNLVLDLCQVELLVRAQKVQRSMVMSKKCRTEWIIELKGVSAYVGVFNELYDK
uniref:Uncharacterized protein n=1 Tax=Setaria digitata TaxID=48799 RepID=A0A915PVZ6_9BILA